MELLLKLIPAVGALALVAVLVAISAHTRSTPEGQERVPRRLKRLFELPGCANALRSQSPWEKPR